MPGTAPPGSSDLLRGSFWLVLAAVFSQGSMLLANLLVANLLGVSGYGHYALLQSTVVVLAGLAQLSFAVVISQQVSSLRVQNPTMAGEVAAFCFLVTAVIGIVFTAGLLIGREALAAALFRDSTLSRGLALAALALPWFAISAVQQGLFNGLERFRDQAAISVMLIPVVVLLPAAGAYYGGFEGALVGLGLAYFSRAATAQVIISLAFRRMGIAWSLRNLRSKLRLVRDYALPATLAGTLISLAIFGGQTLLVRSEAGAAELGLFAAAFTVKTMVMFLPNQIVGVLLPILSRFHSGPEKDKRRGLLYLNLAANLLATLGLVGLGILLAPQIMGLFGQDFASGSSVLAILLLAAPFEAATITLYQDVQSKGLFWLPGLTVNLPVAITVLAGAALLIPAQQAQGLAMAWLFGWMVALVGTILAMRLGSGARTEKERP